MPQGSDLAVKSAVELAALVRTRQALAVEVVDAVLARIERVAGPLNAFVVLDADRARAAARDADEALARGAAPGPLHGVPVTIKDVQAVAGLPTRRGSRISDATPAQADAPAVARLRTAGAIIVGKTTTTEQGWTATSDSPLTGATHNPWRHGFTAGGSSSGAAALAASGCGPLHLGTDGAGSVRIPAHFCGIVGLKPTFGRVPYVPVPNNSSLSHIGPLTRDVADAALMLEVMSGADPRDPTSLATRFTAPLFDPSLIKGLRIAFSPTLGHARVERSVAALVSDAAHVFASFGASVEQVDPAWGSEGGEIIRPLWLAAMRGQRPSDPAAMADVDPALAACLDDAAALGLDDIIAAQGRRLAYAGAVGTWFAGGWDLLLTPTASVPAFEVGRVRPAHWPAHPWDWLVWAEFSYPFNLAHTPAVSVPCGVTDDGLPVGLQIVGPRHADERVLQAAAAFLAARPFAAGRRMLTAPARPGQV